MSQNNPTGSAGGAGRGSGGRRGGLDRLRAARGEADVAPPVDNTADDTVDDTRATILVDDSDTRELTADREDDLDRVGAGGGTAEPEREDLEPGRRARRPSRGRRAAAGTNTESAEGDEVDSPADPDEGRGGRVGRSRRFRPSRGGGSVRRGATTAAGQRSRRKQTLLAVGLALLVIALAIPVIGMRHRIVGESNEERAVKALVEKREAGLVAARQFAITFFTFDYRKVDDFTRQVQAMTVGDFNRDFTNRQGDLRSTLQQVESVASARVLSAGVSKVSNDIVEVLIVADQDVRNKASQGKTVTNRYRLAVTVQQTPRGWLVNGVNPVV
jgi:hypothetical protein